MDPNASFTSLDENMYDISIALNTPKKHYKMVTPRRTPSHTSLATLNEFAANTSTSTVNSAASAASVSKRPSDYFVAKLTASNANLVPSSPIVLQNAAMALTGPGTGSSTASINSTGTAASGIRPKLGESILSIQSEETNNSQFDVADTRLSSLSSTSTSMVSPSPSDSPAANHFAFANTPTDLDEVQEGDEEQDDQFSMDLCDMVNSSLSTITLKNAGYSPKPVMYSASVNPGAASTAGFHSAQNMRPKHKSFSTTNVLNTSPTAHHPAAFASASSLVNGSSPTLSRTKSKFLSAKQRLERQQLRKKVYDENCDDDDLLNNDLDFVFNVPVIRNHSEIFANTNASRASRSKLNLSLTELVREENGSGQYYPAKKPFALPGGTCNNSDDETDSFDPEFNTSYGDAQVTNDITRFYSERSTSISKYAKITREKELLYKLPNYVKSQSSIDDLTLMSAEKLNHLDQSRPINLPPKRQNDINKHTKEFMKCLSDFELNSQNLAAHRNRKSNSILKSHQEWDELKQSSNFSRKIYKEKNAIRNLNWISNCPSEIKLDVWKKFLNHPSASSLTTPASPGSNSFSGEAFEELMDKITKFSQSALNNKDSEFYSTIEIILSKPIYQSIINADENLDLRKLKTSFKTLLYLQSMSSDGLRKHDEAFLIPTLLFVFHSHPLKEIFEMLTLFNKKVFTNELLKQLNLSLNNWSIPGSSNGKLQKYFGIDHLKEFENLNSNYLWEIISQLNDKLPLSLSAPSTPLSFFAPSHPENSQQPYAISESTSATLELLAKLLQSLVVYTNSSSPIKFQEKVLQSLLATIFRYYHFGWNSYTELTSHNISIKLNHSDNAEENLASFVTKWKDCMQYV